jgi:hypothetical protein
MAVESYFTFVSFCFKIIVSPQDGLPLPLRLLASLQYDYFNYLVLYAFPEPFTETDYFF